MAEKGQGRCQQDLVCPLCLDILDDATILSCGHTFCQKCLQKYDDWHSELDHVICPLCRKETKLEEKRMKTLPRNVAINGLVDDHLASVGGLNALLEVQQKCTSCFKGLIAVSFCIDCDVYMCEVCASGHDSMKFLFADHQVSSMRDIEIGAVTIVQTFMKCPVHKLEPKDLFCEECGIHICLKCVVVNHRDHKIKNQEDFEKEIRLKIDDLTQCCQRKKSLIEKNIQNIELDRQKVRSAAEKLEVDINGMYSRKLRCLNENHKSLLEEVRLLQKGFDDEFNDLKSKRRHDIKQMTSCLALVMNHRLSALEGDSLATHNVVCSDLDSFLKQTIDEETSKCVRENAQSARFEPADETLLALGRLDLGKRSGVGKSQQISGEQVRNSRSTARESTSRVESNEDVYTVGSTNVSKSQNVSRGSVMPPTMSIPLSVTNNSLNVVRQVDLPAFMWGVAVMSQDTAVVGYGPHRSGADCYNLSSGGRCHLKGEVGSVWDIAVLTDGRSVVSHVNTIRVYNTDGSPTCIQYTCSGYNRLCSDHHDNIYAVSAGNADIHIFQGADTNPQRVVRTGSHKPAQICVTKTGVMITSTCDRNTPSTVMVHDRDGRAGSSITASDKDERLYAAVDSQDRVFVARVRDKSDILRLSVYTLEGTTLVRQRGFNELKLHRVIGNQWSSYCYMVCLTPHLLAFSNDQDLYIVAVPS